MNQRLAKRKVKQARFMPERIIQADYIPLYFAVFADFP